MRKDPYVYELPQQLKVQIVHIWEDIVKDFPAAFFHGPDVIYSGICQKLCKAFGVFRLTDRARPSARLA